jgi:hypothetical protein
MSDIQIEKRGPARAPAAVAERTPMRSSIRDAAARAREIRESAVATDEGVDRFFVNPAEQPDGWDYQWIMTNVAGKDEPQHMTSMRRRGWDPVPADRHPNIMVDQAGMRLCERPLEITQEARARDLRNARAAVAVKEEQLGVAGAGEYPRNEAPEIRPRITRSYEAVEIPEE